MSTADDGSEKCATLHDVNELGGIDLDVQAGPAGTFAMFELTDLNSTQFWLNKDQARELAELLFRFAGPEDWH